MVSVEIEDDDDDESFPSDPGASVESETFYLAPPPPGSTSLDADLRDLGDNELDDLPENLLGELLEDALDMPRSRHTQGGSLSSANAPTDPGEKAPTSPPAPKPGGAPTKGISSADVGYLFGGYAVFSVSDQHHIFGRRYGKKLVDAHEYKGTRLQDAYRSFVSDKVREGFAPRTDLTRDAPAESKLRPLDMDTLTTAMRELA